ncbi:MAG: KH domain-containing protein [Candidatus Micrarchaeia archaeon]
MNIILPGSKIPPGLKGNGISLEGNEAFANVVGMIDDEKGQFIPLEGLWYPKPGDTVIGTVISTHVGVYVIDLDSPYKGIIMAKYEHTRFEEGDIVEAVVREFREFDEAMTVMLTRPKKLYGGILLKIKPPKIPRVIGRGNTMINQITEATKSSIIVGMNGTIWLKGGDINLASEAIKIIEAEAHVSGLTDKIKNMLEERKKR